MNLGDATNELQNAYLLWEAKGDKATTKQQDFLRSLAKKAGAKKLAAAVKKAGLKAAELDDLLKGLGKDEAGKLIGLLLKTAG